MLLFIFYALAINGLAWLAFAMDKRAAQAGLWRTSEQTLIGLALIGGAPGAWAAQQQLRHKTKKEPFRTGLPLLAAAWAGGWIALAALVGFKFG